jgi:hypothetical protein
MTTTQVWITNQPNQACDVTLIIIHRKCHTCRKLKLLLTELMTSFSGRDCCRADCWAGTNAGADVLKYELSTAATGVGTGATDAVGCGTIALETGNAEVGWLTEVTDWSWGTAFINRKQNSNLQKEWETLCYKLICNRFYYDGCWSLTNKIQEINIVQQTRTVSTMMEKVT